MRFSSSTGLRDQAARLHTPLLSEPSHLINSSAAHWMDISSPGKGAGTRGLNRRAFPSRLTFARLYCVINDEETEHTEH